jgi:Uma2 family endonuclease
MSARKPRPLLRIAYEEAAEAYLRSLPLDHFMEATDQATQREIFVESLALVHAQRPEVQYFNDLLIQYPWGRDEHIERVVPDNMVVAEPIRARGSYDLPFQPVGPLWVLEYVSKSNKRKDYDESFRKYERQLKVPYYLVFYPDTQDLTLFKRGRSRYAAVKPNGSGRVAIEPLEMEMALVDGWVRFWFRGELLPLPGELLREKRHAEQQTRHAEQQAQHHRQENEQMRAQLRAMGIEPEA